MAWDARASGSKRCDDQPFCVLCLEQHESASRPVSTIAFHIAAMSAWRSTRTTCGRLCKACHGRITADGDGATMKMPGGEDDLVSIHVDLKPPRPRTRMRASGMTPRVNQRRYPRMAGVKGMRTGGQNRKPAALHVLQGTFRKPRHGRVSPEPPAGVPEPPGALSGESRAEWDRMIVRLTARGHVVVGRRRRCCGTTASCGRMAAGCRRTRTPAARGTQDLGRRRRASTEPKLHPVFAALKRYRLALRVYLVEFGLTPLAGTASRRRPGGTRSPRWIRRKRSI